jgi:hypothetical protein
VGLLQYMGALENQCQEQPRDEMHH